MGKSYLLVLILIAIIIFGSLILHKKRKGKIPYSYKKVDFFMSRPEHEFFDILLSVIGNQYHVFPQVHLSKILEHKIIGQNWHGAFRHIDEKSVDFVLCDKQYIKPILAIELDDYSHERIDRQKRDGEVERILKEAGLPLLRFENRGHFKKEEISQRISETLRCK